MYLQGRSYSIDKIIIDRAKRVNTQNHYCMSCLERRQGHSFCVWSPQGVCIEPSSELLQFFLCYLFFYVWQRHFLNYLFNLWWLLKLIIKGKEVWKPGDPIGNRTQEYKAVTSYYFTYYYYFLLLGSVSLCSIRQ